MMLVTMKFYNDVNLKLKNYISHYWTTAGELDSEKSFKIFPMDHIDLIIPIMGDYYYVNKDGKFEDKSQVFYHGMRDTAVEVVRHGYVECIGISFKPWGFYPFVKKDISEYQNKSVDLLLENKELATELLNISKEIESVHDKEKIENIIARIEDILLRYLEDACDFYDTAQFMTDLCSSTEDNIEVIAKEYNIAIRTLERMFNKYIGINPRTFYKIRQFEDASRAVLFDSNLNLTDIAYDSNYYDQAHFSRTFKRYTRETPKKVRRNKTALKSHMDFE